MAQLKNIVINGDTLYSNYTMFDPWAIPVDQIDYWMDKQLNGQTTQQVVQEFIDADEVYPYHIQNSIMAITQDIDNIKPETRRAYFSKYALIIGMGTMLGLDNKKLMGVALFEPLIGLLCEDDDLLTVILLLVLFSTIQAQEMVERALNLFKDKYKQEVSDLYYNTLASFAKSRTVYEEEVRKPKKPSIPYPKLVPYPDPFRKPW